VVVAGEGSVVAGEELVVVDVALSVEPVLEVAPAAEAGTVPDEVARATAAAPVPVPRMSARPAAVLVKRERRGLRGRAGRGIASGPGGGGVKG
jgi:hypothetical protein